MKRWIMICLAACLLLAVTTSAEQPEWTYPLAPEILADNEGYITLANRENLLASDYVPDDLVTITVRKVVKGELREAAHTALSEMFEAAKAEGYTLYAKSVYRSYGTQKTMYNNRMQKIGRDDGVVAYPGASDHQTGLGIDVLNYEWTKKDGMTAAFGQTNEARWMAAHCAEFGFVIRYMEDKEEITGIIYEPWHLRYVGKEVARYMDENHLSLEEFTSEWQEYVAGYEQRGGDLEELLRERSHPDDMKVLFTTDDGEEEISIFR